MYILTYALLTTWAFLQPVLIAIALGTLMMYTAYLITEGWDK